MVMAVIPVPGKQIHVDLCEIEASLVSSRTASAITPWDLISKPASPLFPPKKQAEGRVEQVKEAVHQVAPMKEKRSWEREREKKKTARKQE